MTTDQDTMRENQMILNRQEMYRKSQDTIRIYNPLEVEFRYKYEGYWHTIGPKQTKDVRRFLAAHYFKKISERIIGDELLEKGYELLAQREAANKGGFMDKYVENKEVWDKMPRLDDADRKRKIAQIVIQGVVEEYGFELPDEIAADMTPVDYRPLENQIMDEFNKKVDNTTITPKTAVKPLSVQGKVTASEVTSE